MFCDPRFRLARVYRRTPAALAVLAEVQAAFDTIDTGSAPWPDERLSVLRTAHAQHRRALVAGAVAAAVARRRTVLGPAGVG